MNGLDSGSRSLGVTSPEIGQSKRDGERMGVMGSEGRREGRR